jgi:hypothetical protein
MTHPNGSCRWLIALIVGAFLPAWGGNAAAATLTVNPGSDLFATLAGTNFPALGPLMGVPLGTFDFGSGPESVGNTDTIEHRIAGVTVAAAGDTGTTRLELLALQLETVAPVNFGGSGIDNYFFVLQSVRGGPATVGTMDITFLSTAGGTFSSFFDVFFDIRKGSLDGPIVFSDQLTATNLSASWTRIAPPGAVIIPGVNFQLNGTDTDTDFWPTTPLQFVFPNEGVHVVTNGGLPEPSSIVLAAIGLGGVGFVTLRKKFRRA